MNSDQKTSRNGSSERIFVGIVFGALVSWAPFLVSLTFFHDSPMVMEKFGVLLFFGLTIGGLIGAMLFWFKYNTVIRLIGSGLLGLLIGLIVFMVTYYLF